MNEFNAKKTTEELINWIRSWFDENGKDCNAVLGVSGGKDSNIVAALCVKALGKNRVIGVSMPNTLQQVKKEQFKDDECVEKLINHLGIKFLKVDIGSIYEQVLINFCKATHWEPTMSGQAKTNLSPRLRMSVLYAVSQSFNGRVVNTDNLSENYVGYFTKWGNVGDFSPLANLTVSEVKAIGRELGLPNELIDRVPSDGLCGKTDEDNLGFSYEILDKYIRTGICENAEIKEKIDKKHNDNLFKFKPVASFKNVIYD